MYFLNFIPYFSQSARMFTPSPRHFNSPKEAFYDSISEYNTYVAGHWCINDPCDSSRCPHHLYIALCCTVPYNSYLRNVIPFTGPMIPKDKDTIQADVLRMVNSEYGPQFCAFNMDGHFTFLDSPLGIAMASENVPIETVVKILVLTLDYLLIVKNCDSEMPPLKMLRTTDWGFSDPGRLPALKTLFTPVKMLGNLRLFCQLLNGNNFRPTLKRTKIQ